MRWFMLMVFCGDVVFYCVVHACEFDGEYVYVYVSHCAVILYATALAWLVALSDDI